MSSVATAAARGDASATRCGPGGAGRAQGRDRGDARRQVVGLLQAAGREEGPRLLLLLGRLREALARLRRHQRAGARRLVPRARLARVAAQSAARRAAPRRGGRRRGGGRNGEGRSGGEGGGGV